MNFNVGSVASEIAADEVAFAGDRLLARPGDLLCMENRVVTKLDEPGRVKPRDVLLSGAMGIQRP